MTTTTERRLSRQLSRLIKTCDSFLDSFMSRINQEQDPYTADVMLGIYESFADDFDAFVDSVGDVEDK